MKKQELIHLHGLLGEVTNQFEMRSNSTVDVSDYEATGVQPTSIHRSKTAHQDAVFELTDALTSSMEEEMDALAQYPH